jgi:hypothetical protein
VSRRASSVYQFFQYKEELRTAKISATVIVVAFICWGPFFLNLALLTLLGPSSGPEGFNLNAQRLHRVDQRNDILLPKISGSSRFCKGPRTLLPLIFGSSNIPDKNSKIGRKFYYLEKLNSRIGKKPYYLEKLNSKIGRKTYYLEN